MLVEFELLVLALLRGFFSGFFGFLSPQKPTSPNSCSTRIEDPHENHLINADVASSLNSPEFQFLRYDQARIHTGFHRFTKIGQIFRITQNSKKGT